MVISGGQETEPENCAAEKLKTKNGAGRNDNSIDSTRRETQNGKSVGPS